MLPWDTSFMFSWSLLLLLLSCISIIPMSDERKMTAEFIVRFLLADNIAGFSRHTFAESADENAANLLIYLLLIYQPTNFSIFRDVSGVAV